MYYAKDHKIEVLKSASRRDAGNYYKLLKLIYNLHLKYIDEHNQSYSTISLKQLSDTIRRELPAMESINPSSIIEYQRALAKLGYLKIVLEQGEWHIYITKDLDF